MSSKVEKCNNTSVGMIIKRDDKILLIERKKFPYGFAPPAGHVDDGEEFESAAKRELSEEVGIETKEIKLLLEGRKNNQCRRPNGGWHYWKIYKIVPEDLDFELRPSEVKQANWYSKDEIKKLSEKTTLYQEGKITDKEWQESPGLEVVWYDWFRKLKIIQGK